MRRKEQQSCQTHTGMTLLSLDTAELQHLSYQERQLTWAATFSGYEPRERPSQSGSLRKN